MVGHRDRIHTFDQGAEWMVGVRIMRGFDLMGDIEEQPSLFKGRRKTRYAMLRMLSQLQRDTYLVLASTAALADTLALLAISHVWDEKGRCFYCGSFGDDRAECPWLRVPA